MKILIACNSEMELHVGLVAVWAAALFQYL